MLDADGRVSLFQIQMVELIIAYTNTTTIVYVDILSQRDDVFFRLAEIFTD